jgi:hypothetical protein
LENKKYKFIGLKFTHEITKNLIYTIEGVMDSKDGKVVLITWDNCKSKSTDFKLVEVITYFCDGTWRIYNK